ncbi:MAG: aldo/keto reductase [Chloroflexota bacterium]
MKFRYLGNTGLLVSRIALGTMTFGTPDWGSDEAISHAVIKRYLDAGGNHLDAANMYGGGRTEEIIGALLPQLNRDEIIISSKCFFPMAQKPNFFGTSRKHLIASVENSLRKLQTDYIDLYYLHGPDPITPMEESLRTLNDLVRQGKIRYLGVSNFFGWQLAKAQGIARELNLEPIVATQPLYNLVQRGSEAELIPAALDSGVGVIPYSPLGGGFLTGKYADQQEPEKGTRMDYRQGTDGPRFWHEKGFATAKILHEVSEQAGIPMAKLAVAWVLKRRFVTSVILGARKPEQLDVTLEAGTWDMPDDIFGELEQRTRPHEDYLTWFVRRSYQRHFDAGEFHNPDVELL